MDTIASFPTAVAALVAPPPSPPPLDAFLSAATTSFYTWYAIYPLATFFLILIGPYVQPYKLNPAPWPTAMIIKEFFRSNLSLLISGIVETALTYLAYNTSVLSFALPCDPHPTTGDFSAVFSAVLNCPIEPARFFSLHGFLRFALFLLWADLHFYLIHSAMHVNKFLYKHIHKVHHESINTNPLSGLSFHWLEGAIYFTSLCLCFILPMSAVEVRILKLGLIVSPIGGHYGYSLQGPTGAQPQHYLHHTKFNYNYGAGLFPEGFWCDLVMGTRYLGKESGKRD